MPPHRSSTPLQDTINQYNIPILINSTKRMRTSWIWGHGKEVKGKHDVNWRCNHCPLSIAKVYSDATISHAIKHFCIHGIAEEGKISTNQTTLSTKPEIDSTVLRKLISEWIVDRRQSFNEIEAESFRRIIAYLDTTTVSKLPMTGETI